MKDEFFFFFLIVYTFEENRGDIVQTKGRVRLVMNQLYLRTFLVPFSIQITQLSQYQTSNEKEYLEYLLLIVHMGLAHRRS